MNLFDPRPEMDEETFTTGLQDLLFPTGDDVELQVESVSTFENSGVMTRNQGLVVRTSDGSEFQVTVVQSR